MKRLTKAQKEEQAKDALKQRLSDIYSGAQGMEWGDDDFATAELLSNVVPAIMEVFGIDKTSWLVGPRVLNHFDNPASAAEFLFDQGVRA